MIFISQLVEVNYSNAHKYFENKINPFVQYCCGYFTSKILSVEVLIFVKQIISSKLKEVILNVLPRFVPSSHGLLAKIKVKNTEISNARTIYRQFSTSLRVKLFIAFVVYKQQQMKSIYYETFEDLFHKHGQTLQSKSRLGFMARNQTKMLLFVSTRHGKLKFVLSKLRL